MLQPRSPVVSLQLCHKIKMLGPTLARVNINTHAADPQVSQGSGACGGGKGGNYSSTLSGSPDGSMHFTL